MKQQSSDFNQRTLEDYVTDPRFINWVLAPTAELSAYWENIRSVYPEQHILMDKAVLLVSGMNFKPKLMEEQELNDLWLGVAAKTTNRTKKSIVIPLWLRSAAAACLALAFMSLFFFYYTQQTLEVQTGYGEKKTIMLPDSSMITLNANSKIQYRKHWSKDNKREVWISGEAFFAVNHLHRQGIVKESERFIVHAGKLAIEVLGTTFNVHDRRGLVNVALVTGKISLGRSDKQNIIMKPGEVLEYIPVQDTIVRKRVKTIQKIAWKNEKLEFYQTPVAEVFIQLEDVYGYKAVFRNQTIKQKKLTGTFVTGTEDALLKGLSVALGVTITKNKKSNELIIE